MGQNDLEKVEMTYSPKTEVPRFQALWQELGEIARRNENRRGDLLPLLTYRYPGHVRDGGDPACQENGTPDAVRNGRADRRARRQQGATK